MMCVINYLHLNVIYIMYLNLKHKSLFNVSVRRFCCEDAFKKKCIQIYRLGQISLRYNIWVYNTYSYRLRITDMHSNYSELESPAAITMSCVHCVTLKMDRLPLYITHKHMFEVGACLVPASASHIFQ